MAKEKKVSLRPAGRIVKRVEKSMEEMKAAFMAGCNADVDLKGFKKQERIMLYSLKLTKGNVSAASKMISISRRTFYNYAETNEKFAEAMNDYQYEINTDMVVSQLLRRCELGSDASIKYYLECQGKDRGFGNTSSIKVDHTTKGESMNKALNNMTDEELQLKLKSLTEKMK